MARPPRLEIYLTQRMKESLDQHTRRTGNNKADVVRLALCRFLGLPDEEAESLRPGRPTLEELSQRGRK